MFLMVLPDSYVYHVDISTATIPHHHFPITIIGYTIWCHKIWLLVVKFADCSSCSAVCIPFVPPLQKRDMTYIIINTILAVDSAQQMGGCG